MTGHELTEWIDIHGLSQNQAVEILGLGTRTTLHNQRSKGDKDISPAISKLAIEYGIARATNDMASSFLKLNGFFNELLILSRNGRG